MPKNDSFKLQVVDKTLELSLLPGEEILFEGLPDRDALYKSQITSSLIVLLCTCVCIPLIPFAFWYSKVFAQNHRYWLTTHRVIVANKVIGYNVRSIPLERISDVGVRSTMLERLFGVTSIVVRDMTGEVQGGAQMLAVPNAADVQAQILDYVRQVNRVQAPQASAQVGPYRQVESLGNQGQMMRLLERIEENTRSPGARIASSEGAASAAAEALAEAELEAEFGKSKA